MTDESSWKEERLLHVNTSNTNIIRLGDMKALREYQAVNSDGETLVDIGRAALGRILVAIPVASQGIEPPSDQVCRLPGMVSIASEVR